MVTARRSRFHYGCTFNCTYQSGTDSEHQKYWCPRHERFMVREKMNWYIKKVSPPPQGVSRTERTRQPPQTGR
jgi:hypothetical protein